MSPYRAELPARSSLFNGISAGTTSLTTTITATLGITLQNTVTVKRKTGKEGVVKESAVKEAATKELALETVPRLTTRPQDISRGESGPSPGAQTFIRPEERPPV